MQVFEYGVDEWLALCKHFKRLSDKYPDDWEAPASADLEDSTLVRSMNQMSISCLCMDLTSLENAPLFLPSNTSVPLQEMIEQKARLHLQPACYSRGTLQVMHVDIGIMMHISCALNAYTAWCTG